MFYSGAYDLTEYVVCKNDFQNVKSALTSIYLKTVPLHFQYLNSFFPSQIFFLSLLLGSSEDHLVPVLVNGLRGYHIIDVACGSGDAHSLAVADDGGCIGILHWYFLELVHSKPVLS